MVAVELVAAGNKESLETVVWLGKNTVYIQLSCQNYFGNAGCVQYDGVRRVWETRTSQTVSQRLSQTNLLSIFGQTKVKSKYYNVPNQK